LHNLKIKKHIKNEKVYYLKTLSLV